MENWEKVLEELFTGVMGMSDPTVWVMFAIGAVLIWLGVKKDYEPMLLFPMGVAVSLPISPDTLRSSRRMEENLDFCLSSIRRASPMSFSRC